MRRLFEKITHRRVQNQGIQRDSQRNAADTGLKMIYEGAGCCVDIVAIHGDGGHYKDSWTHPDSQVFWLRDLLPSIIPESKILAFGYSASKSDLVPAEEICQSLLREILEMRISVNSKQRPIIFIAHSFGVLLLKAALAMSPSSEFDDIISSTRGIIFFGSPPDISHSLQSLMSSFPSTTDTAIEPAGLVEMKKDLTWLRDGQSRYNELEKKGLFEVTYFLESAGERHESPDTIREKYIRMRKGHGMMIRFSGPDDEDFCLVKERIQRIMKNQITD